MFKDCIFIIPQIHSEQTTDYHGQTVKILSQSNRVLYTNVNNIKSESFFNYIVRYRKIRPVFLKKGKNLFEFQPLNLLPFIRFRLISKINLLVDLLIFSLSAFLIGLKFPRSKKFVWHFHPYSLKYCYLMFSYRSIYDCLDYHSSVFKKDKTLLRTSEKMLIKKSAFVFVNSEILFRLNKDLKNEIYLVPQGFRAETFIGSRKTKELQYFEGKIKNWKTPVIGYVGGINYRLDYDLIFSLARRNPGWTIVLWGPQIEEKEERKLNTKKYTDRLKNVPNIIRGHSVNKNEIPLIIKKFTVCIIPYSVRYDFNRYCFPMKVFEYFYSGKPVVSTPIAELSRFNPYVRIAESVAEWEKEIAALLLKRWPTIYIKEQKKLATLNSWERKIARISTIIGQVDQD